MEIVTSMGSKMGMGVTYKFLDVICVYSITFALTDF